MKNIVFFNIIKENDKWRLSGRVESESISEVHDTKDGARDRAIEILQAYKYTKGKDEQN
jgi:hypothetical protein